MSLQGELLGSRYPLQCTRAPPPEDFLPPAPWTSAYGTARLGHVTRAGAPVDWFP